MAWVSGTTQLHDLGHTPPLSGHQPSPMNHGELGWGPLNLSSKRAHLQAPSLVSAAKVCANANRVPGMGPRGTRRARHRQGPCSQGAGVPVRQVLNKHTCRWETRGRVGELPGRKLKQDERVSDEEVASPQERPTVNKGLSPAET